MNRVELVGRITRDVELKTSNSGDVKFVSFSLAVDRIVRNAQGEKQADFINCVAFGRTAEVMQQYVKKGMLLSVEGRLQTRTQQGTDGINRTMTDVIVENMQMLERREGQSQQGGYSNNGYNNNQGYNNNNNYNNNNGYNNNQNGYKNNVNNNSFNDFNSYQDRYQQQTPSNNGFGQNNNQQQNRQQQEKEIVMPSFNVTDDDLPF